MTLPPLPTPKGADTFGADYTADQLRDYARAAIAAHVPEAAFGNIAAVPAQPVAWLGGDGHPHHISAVQTITERRIYGPWQPLYAAPQAVPVPADRSGKRRLVTDVTHLSDAEIKPALDRLKRRIATDREFAKSLLPSWSDDELDGLAAAQKEKPHE